MLGADSRIDFTAPADGDDIVRVSDIRGYGGDTYQYKLTVRPPRPDFTVKRIDAKDLTIGAGSGKEFTVNATRKDEFDGEIQISFTNLPPGFHVTNPLTIQPGQSVRARGTIYADAETPAPCTPENAKPRNNVDPPARPSMAKPSHAKTQATGRTQTGGAANKNVARILPATKQPSSTEAVDGADKPVEIVIAPGETVSATLKVERHGFDGEIKFGTELSGRNLPHGVYVDNIGLNGITSLAGETERTIFLTVRPTGCRNNRGCFICRLMSKASKPVCRSCSSSGAARARFRSKQKRALPWLQSRISGCQRIERSTCKRDDLVAPSQLVVNWLV